MVVVSSEPELVLVLVLSVSVSGQAPELVSVSGPVVVVSPHSEV